MTVDRVRLAWRVPCGVWNRFEEHVAEKHGATEGYLRFEVESAMREFLDEDDLLAEAEELLRAHTDLRGLSSSTEVLVQAADRYDGDTRKVHHRVHPGLKERFATFADEHDAASYGRCLAMALDAYTDGGRARRLLADVERLVAGGDGSGTTDASVENPSESSGPPLSTAAGGGATTVTTDDDGVDVEPRHVIAAAEELPDDVFTREVLEKAIARTVGDGREHVVDAYRAPVLDQVNAGEHPAKDDVYITAAYREEIDLWPDMGRDERLVLLRRYAAAEAVNQGDQRAEYSYRDVQELFELYASGGAPSHQYAYELMAEAAKDEQGFSFGEYHGQQQFRVDLTKVNAGVRSYALDRWGVDPTDLGFDADVTSWTAGTAPSQGVSADDD